MGVACWDTCLRHRSPTGPTASPPSSGTWPRAEPQPLEDREPVEPEWWEFDEVAEEWGPRRSRLMGFTAVVLAAALLVAGVGTVLELVLSAH